MPVSPSRWIVRDVLEEAGEIIQEQKVSTAPKAMKEAFANMAQCRMAIEDLPHSRQSGFEDTGPTHQRIVIRSFGEHLHSWPRCFPDWWTDRSMRCASNATARIRPTPNIAESRYPKATLFTKCGA